MVEKGSARRAQLLFVLAWFHAVVQVCMRPPPGPTRIMRAHCIYSNI